MKCPKCDAVFEDTSYFCTNCGAPNESITVQSVSVPEAMPAEVPPPVAKKKKSWAWLIILGALVILGGIVVAAVVLLNMFGGFQKTGKLSGSGILVGFPKKSDQIELYSFKYGKQLEDIDPMLKKGEINSSYLYQFSPDYGFHSVGAWGTGSGYIKGTNKMLLSYNDDGDISLYYTGTAPKEMLAIFESSNPFYAIVFPDGKTIFINETRDNNNTRCYISINGEEANQVGKGDYCTISVAGGVIFLSDVSSKGLLTVTSVDLEGKNEKVILDDEENVRDNSFGNSYYGNRIYYTVDDGKDVRFKMVDTQDGKVTESEGFYNILEIQTPFEGEDAGFIAENEEGTLELYTLDSKGQNLIASGYSILARFDKTGDNLVYMVGDDEENQTINIHPMRGGKDIEVMSGEYLSFSMAIWKDYFLIEEIDEDDITIYSVKTDGSDLTKIFSETVYSLDSILNPFDTDLLIISTINDEGLYSLYTTQFGSKAGDYILEEWSSVKVHSLSPDGATLLVSGVEDIGDDMVLMALDMSGKTKPVELDDDDIEGVSNAVFSSNAKEAIYSVSTGTNYDDLETRKVRVDGEEKYEVVYKEAAFLDVEWAYLDAFNYLGYFSSPTVSSSICPGATTLEVDKTVKGTIDDVNFSACFRFTAQPNQDYTFLALGNDEQNLYMELYDREGVYLQSDDDSGLAFNPMIYWTGSEENAAVFVKIMDYTSSDMNFEITVKEGKYDPELDSAIELKTNGEVKTGKIETSETLELTKLGFYGEADLYFFEGKSGQTFSVDVMTHGTSSAMDPTIAILGADQYLYEYDDNSGTDNDAHLEFILPENGKYYLIVLDNWSNSGPTYFYTIKATLR